MAKKVDLEISVDANDMESMAEAVKAGVTTLELLQTWITDNSEVEAEMIDDCLVVGDSVYADDGNAEVEYNGMSGSEAAQQYVDDGDWNEVTETFWVDVRTWRYGIDNDGEIVRVDEHRHTVTVDPDEPDCIDGHDHIWDSPFSILGGCKENPGVQGHGGGVICNEVCMLCGCKKVTDTWAQNPSNGEQGLTSVEYVEGEFADEVNQRHVKRAKDNLDTEAEQSGEYEFDLVDEDGDQVGADEDELREYGIALLADPDNAKIQGFALSTPDEDDNEEDEDEDE